MTHTVHVCGTHSKDWTRETEHETQGFHQNAVWRDEEMKNVDGKLKYWEESLRLPNISSQEEKGWWEGIFKSTIVENFSGIKKHMSPKIASVTEGKAT